MKDLSGGRYAKVKKHKAICLKQEGKAESAKLKFI